MRLLGPAAPQHAPRPFNLAWPTGVKRCRWRSGAGQPSSQRFLVLLMHAGWAGSAGPICAGLAEGLHKRGWPVAADGAPRQ